MKIKGIILLCIAMLFLPIALEANEEIFHIPSDSDVYFRSFHIEGSTYLHLRQDGTYQRIAREHMFVEEDDNGEWLQVDTGELTLISERHYRDIEAFPLSIFMWYPEAADRLPFLKSSIKKLLSGNRTNFNAKEIEEIEKYGYENCLSRISVDDSAAKITKKQLEALLVKMNLFLEDKQKNYFHAIPMRYKSVVFLLWKDYGIPLNRNLIEIKERIDSLEKDEECPLYVYCVIDQKIFKKEANTTQEFIFYPEMTEKVRGMIDNNEK